ncbi:GPI inositol-deacylase [Agrilus planipennis]|uniref:GPI inositol-deacylase n=1 Tax=Agrilus planipennis TaxID=224129 RepID=A0A1W4WDY2_AGRPL|nr:GPI inositol-deacylase [Agrilus planipennis]
MAFINVFIIICLLVVSQFLLGILVFLSDKKENKCEMTYMFEYPQFVKISISPTVDHLNEQYGLYAYSEGRLTERARNMYFDGIPVLFVPGNKGSHKQVRSFASIALRKALNSRPGFHFDFFTVDINEEFSALNGALLYQQTKYVKHCIKRILELYDGSLKNKPSSIILIGHSMGGVIAESILSSLQTNSTVLPLVITLATYHTRPPLAFDWYMSDFYKQIEQGVDLSRNTTLISIAGGFNDLLVPTYLTKPNRHHCLHTVSTSVPKVWLTTDHLSILWCKQLVLAITRALFEIVNRRTKQIIDDPEQRMTIFHHHLVQNSGIKINHRDRYDLPVSTRAENDEWIEKLGRQYTINLPRGTRHLHWYMIRLLDQPKHEALTLIAVNLEVTDWVFACPAIFVKNQSRVCEEGRHLSHYSEISSTANYKRRTLRINLHELMKTYTKATHLVVKVPPTDDPVTLHVDVYSPADRALNVTLPKWWSYPKHVVLKETPENAVHYELLFPQLTHMVQSYLLYVEPVKCKNAAHHATASLIVPWAYQDVHSYITNTERDPLQLRLYSSKPHGAVNLTAFARLVLDPSCKYSVSIKSSYLGMLGQMIRLYSPLLIANTAVVILLSIRSQFHSIACVGHCSLFFTAIKEGVKPYYILTTVKVASKILSLKAFTEYLPNPDWHIMAEDGSELFLLPLLLYICSVGIVWLLASVLAVSVLLCESTVHKVALKLLAKNIAGTLYFSDWLMAGLHKIPSIVAIALIIITLNTCGGLSLSLGTIFYFLKLTQMSQDYIEEIVSGFVKSLARRLKHRFTRKKLPTLTESNGELKQSDSVAEVTEMETLPKANDNETVNSKNGGDAATSAQQKDNVEDEERDFEAETESKGDGNNDELNEKPQPSVDHEYDDSETNATMGSDAELLNVQSDSVHLLELPRNDAIFFHFSLFLLWCMITFLTFPSVLTWAHNFKYSSKLKPDPSFVPGLVLSISAIFLWQMDLPKMKNQGYKELGYVIYFLAALSLIYATLSLYRLVLVLTLVFALIVLHQLLAPKSAEGIVRGSPQQEDEKMTATTETDYDIVKAKWE